MHELLFTGVPSVVVPFERVLDDQAGRARFVEAQGAARVVTNLEPTSLTAALEDVLGRRKQLAGAGRVLVPSNGAEAAAQVLLEVCR